MGDGPGFDVRPEALRGVAAGLRDDAARPVTIGPPVDDALRGLVGVGEPLASAAAGSSSTPSPSC